MTIVINVCVSIMGRSFLYYEVASIVKKSRYTKLFFQGSTSTVFQLCILAVFQLRSGDQERGKTSLIAILPEHLSTVRADFFS